MRSNVTAKKPPTFPTDAHCFWRIVIGPNHLFRYRKDTENFQGKTRYIVGSNGRRVQRRYTARVPLRQPISEPVMIKHLMLFVRGTPGLADVVSRHVIKLLPVSNGLRRPKVLRSGAFFFPFVWQGFGGHWVTGRWKVTLSCTDRDQKALLYLLFFPFPFFSFILSPLQFSTVVARYAGLLISG